MTVPFFRAKPFRAILTALSLAGSLTAWPPPARANVPCKPDFPFQQNWRGGDGIFSVPLLSGKTVWLFGDSFVVDIENKEAGPKRTQATMVANSLGISSCGPEGFKLDYFFRQTTQQVGNRIEQQPAAFFLPPPLASHKRKYWPVHGIEERAKLYLLLEEVETTAGPENGFNFAIKGVTVAEIANYSDYPLKWQINYRPLSQSSTTIPGIALVKSGAFLYLLAVREDAIKKHPLLLNRVALSDLGQSPWPLHYFSQDQRWKPGLDGPDAQILVPEGATEASLHFDPHSQKWVMVHTHSAFFSREVVIRTAPMLTGPWTGQVKHIPFYTEMMPETPGYDKDTFCYAAKAHPAFSRGNELGVSYACNSLNFETLLRRNDLYRPVFKELTLPETNH
ncbi:MAG: DUF4185 domain-containing protein [Candidatus Sericytochromatia bacterium]